MNTSADSPKKSAILDAAQKQFARYGLSKVTMEEIAADLGISKAALYYYFMTKEEIFRQVIAREQQEFIVRVEAIIQKKCSDTDKLFDYFQQHLTFLNELLNLKIVSMQPHNAIRPIMKDLFREFAHRERALLETMLREGKKRREFCFDSAEKTAALLHHVLVGLRIRFLKTLSDREIDQEDIASFSREIKLFAKIFTRGIAP
jgi:TetR/AcrR family transcriptional regulator